MSTSLREELHTLAEQLPDDASWEQVIERLRFRQAVAEGRAAADRGDFASDEAVRRVFRKYGISR